MSRSRSNYLLDVIIEKSSNRNRVEGVQLMLAGTHSFEHSRPEEQALRLELIAQMTEEECRAVQFANSVGLDITLCSFTDGLAGQGYYFGYHGHQRFQPDLMEYIRYVCRVSGLVLVCTSAVSQVETWIIYGYC